VGQGRGQKNAEIVQGIEKNGLKDSKIFQFQKVIPADRAFPSPRSLF
jgi:hypothetical protein